MSKMNSVVGERENPMMKVRWRGIQSFQSNTRGTAKISLSFWKMS